MKRIIITIVLFPYSLLYSQQDSTQIIDELLNSILEESTIDAEDSQLYDLVENLLNNPININSASKNDLLKIPTIDIQTARLVIKYRYENGNYNSLRQLYSIKGVNKENIDEVIPFLTIDEKEIANDFDVNKYFTFRKVNYRSRLIHDIQDRKGFIENKYAGSKYKIYNRFKGETNIYKINLLTEKDAGEKSFADFYSFNISADNFYFFDKLILGDYLIEFGQGLAIWGPYAFSKGSEVISSISKNGRGIVSYSSSDENQFLRGAAAKVNYNNFDFIFFFSSNKIDANIEDEIFITSTPIDGYHRTENELAKKNKSTEIISGSIIKYFPLQNTQVSFLYYNSKFSNSFLPGKIYNLDGNNFNFCSLSYSSIIDRFYISGEAAYNGLSVASINNLQITINKAFSFAASIRNYPRNFYNIHSNGFGESSDAQNEFGIYAGIKAKFSSTRINFYYDQFQFPFATSRNPIPTQGHEFLIDVFHSFSPKTKLRLRYSRESKEDKTDAVIETAYGERRKQKIRMELIYKVSKKIRLKSRIEFSDISLKRSYNSDTGFLAFQDLLISPFNNLNIYTRLIFFDTESYDSRVYEFENDLTGILNNPALFGKGTKWYFLVKYNFLNYFKLSAKYSELYQPELKSLSSGLNEIKGNFYSKFSLQLDYNF